MGEKLGKSWRWGKEDLIVFIASTEDDGVGPFILSAMNACHVWSVDARFAHLGRWRGS